MSKGLLQSYYLPLLDTQIIYINLEERRDRIQEIKGELAKLGMSGTRFPAVKKSPGSLGCGLSHVGVLELAIKRGLKQVLVLEDDAVIVDLDRLKRVLEQASKMDFDVLSLSHNSLTTRVRKDGAQPPEGLVRAEEMQTTAAYLVRGHYMPKLLQTFRKSVQGLRKEGNKSKFAIDIFWKKLQKSDRWLCTNPSVIYQRPGYSDIAQRHHDYTKQLLSPIKKGVPNRIGDPHVPIFVDTGDNVSKLEYSVENYERVIASPYRIIFLYKAVNGAMAQYLARKRAQGYLVLEIGPDGSKVLIDQYFVDNKPGMEFVHVQAGHALKKSRTSNACKLFSGSVYQI